MHKHFTGQRKSRIPGWKKTAGIRNHRKDGTSSNRENSFNPHPPAEGDCKYTQKSIDFQVHYLHIPTEKNNVFLSCLNTDFNFSFLH